MKTKLLKALETLKFNKKNQYQKVFESILEHCLDIDYLQSLMDKYEGMRVKAEDEAIFIVALASHNIHQFDLNNIFGSLNREDKNKLLLALDFKSHDGLLLQDVLNSIYGEPYGQVEKYNKMLYNMAGKIDSQVFLAKRLSHIKTLFKKKELFNFPEYRSLYQVRGKRNIQVYGLRLENGKLF